MGRTEYTIPEDAEEEADIKKRNVLIDSRRDYVRWLQPEIKLINKAFSLEIEVNDKLVPTLSRVWYSHSCWSGEELPPNVTSVLEWCKDHKFKIDKNDYRIFAELTIPLVNCNDVKQMKEEVRKALKQS